MESAYMFDIFYIYFDYLGENLTKKNKRENIEYLIEVNKKRKINIDLKNNYKSILKRGIEEIEILNNYKFRKIDK